MLLKQHARRIADEFSYTENIDLGWLKKVLLVMLTIWAVVIVVNILGNFNDWIPMETGDDLIYLTVTAAVFFGGFHGIKQQVIGFRGRATIFSANSKGSRTNSPDLCS